MRDQFGVSFRQAIGDWARHSSQTGRRLLTAAMALLLATAAVSCGTSTSSGALNGPAGASSSGRIISIPTGANAYVKCMRDAGWQLDEFAAPLTPDGQPGYGWIHPGPMDSGSWDASGVCSSMAPLVPTLSPDEWRQTYNRWVGEYQCLIGLGYRPDPPPSVEVFVASFLSAPGGSAVDNHLWSPMSGVNTDSWTKAQYDEVHAKCTLEDFSDSRFLH